MSSSLDTTLGPAFFGTVSASVFYGIMALQTYVYYQHSEFDGWGWKTLVALLGALETVRICFILHAMYMVFVVHYGNLGFLAYPTWSLVAFVFPGNLSEFIVRSVFAHRVHLLCGRHRRIQGIVVPIAIIILSIVAFLSSSIFAAKRLNLHVTDSVNAVSVFLYIHFPCAIVADFLAAIWLCAVLFHSRTGIQRTDSIIRILMAFSFNTGMVTSLVTTACFITYVVFPTSTMWMGVLFPKSQLYANSLLASLNARQSLRRHAKRADPFPESTTQDGSGHLSLRFRQAQASKSVGSNTFMSESAAQETAKVKDSVSVE